MSYPAAADYYSTSSPCKVHNDYLNAVNAYETANADFDTLWNDVTQSYDAYSQQITARNVLYITAGATVTFGVVSLFIRKPVKNEIFALTLLPNYAAFHWRF